MTSVASEYLSVVRARFADMKKTAERAMAQVSDEELFWSPNADSNSIAIIVKHMGGNMISRWTDLFESDGEKPDRNRDGEFEDAPATREAMLQIWQKGWSTFEAALNGFGEADLLRTVYIRQQPHSVIEAIERQMYHYANHVGQIIYIAKLLRSDGWQSLTIPRRR